MSTRFLEPNPVLVVDDETGAFVMTHNITRVVPSAKEGSTIYLRCETGGGDFSFTAYVDSPLNPAQLRRRLFETDPRQ